MVDWEDLGLENPYTLSFLKMELDNLLWAIDHLKNNIEAFGYRKSDLKMISTIREMYKNYFNIKKEVFG